MRLSQRQGLFGGLALLSCAAVALQYLFARIVSALLGPHLALVAASIPLLGGALGAGLISVVPSLARPPRLFARLSYFACAAAALTIIAMIVVVQPKWTDAAPALAPGRAAILFAVASLPFVFIGAALAAAIQHAAAEISRIALACLIGAAIAVGLMPLALNAGAPRAGLIAAIIAAFSAVLFLFAPPPLPPSPSPSSSQAPPERRAFGGVIATFALGACVLLAGDIGAPWLKLPNLRFARVDKAELQRWSERSLITVDRASGGISGMQIDGASSSPIFEAKKVPDPHPTDLVYVIAKDHGPSLVISPGGGVDIRRALKSGQKTIYAVEPERVIALEVIDGKYREYAGNLYNRPEVKLAVADSRAYVREATVPFQSIIISLPDAWTAASLGTLSLSQEPLYTIEAFRELLDHLAPTGALMVSRWEPELDRLLALASASLRRVGSPEPKDHLFACNQDRTATLIIKRSPLTREDLALLRGTCKKGRFAEAFAPDVPRDGLRRRIVTTPDIALAAPAHPTDLEPPTDDRPFFAYTTPARMLSKVLADPRPLARDNQGLLSILALVAVGLAVSLFMMSIPFFARPSLLIRADGRGHRALSLAYFMSLGPGALLAGACVVERATSLIAHPAYGLFGALLSLIFSAAVGALFTGSIDESRAALAAGRRAQILVALLALYAAFAGALFPLAVHLPLPARVAVAVAFIAPLGILMGALFPLGVKLVAARSPDLMPWCLGLQFAAALAAVGVGILVALHAGFSALFLLASIAFVIAALTVPIDRAAAADASIPVTTAPVAAVPIDTAADRVGPPPGLDSPPAVELEPVPGFGAPPRLTEPPADDAPPTVRGSHVSKVEPLS